jgi:hypothetical protein
MGGDKQYPSKTADLLTQLCSVATSRFDVAEIDYESQIERWNEYQELLDKIEVKCIKTNGDVMLRRNVKHNVKILGDTEVAILSIISLVATVIVFSGIFTNDIYPIFGAGLALVFVGWQVLVRINPPAVIHFNCKPALHIEEYAYMNSAIKAIPKVHHDPVVHLPATEMSIPRSWLAQQGMLKFMESLSDVKPNDALKQ